MCTSYQWHLHATPRYEVSKQRMGTASAPSHHYWCGAASGHLEMLAWIVHKCRVGDVEQTLNSVMLFHYQCAVFAMFSTYGIARSSQFTP